ncbi:hypothetical protein V496_01582 [Pseudogymnoascus sp. VKM F-4515 (FW-2607)]|nr:hypothetical protein V496_01582 [Pseudogymnoascus sp. VKM F-4515 (FW-2607)]
MSTPIALIVGTDHELRSWSVPTISTRFALSVVLLLASFTIIFLAVFSAWSWQLRKDPVNRLSFFENTVPAKKFLLWKEQQCRQTGDHITPPSDYWCVICLSKILDEDTIRGLPCNHCFHQGCLDPWFQRYHDRCPIYTEDSDSENADYGGED